MNLWELVKLAVPDLVNLALTGKLRPRHLWLAIEGATTFRSAVARGDVATWSEQLVRAGKCSRCVWAHQVPKPKIDAVAYYCGEPFKGRTNPDLCGCLCAMTINGRALPAGKTVVASESCPLENEDAWEAASPSTASMPTAASDKSK